MLGGLLASLAPVAARADTCPATTAEVDPTLPTPWQRELEELVARTARAGAPWACHGGTVRIEAIPGGTRRRLVVTDARGREKTQDLETADDVVPLGEALLAQPLAEPEPEPEPAPAPAPPDPGPPPAPVAAPPPPPDRATKDAVVEHDAHAEPGDPVTTGGLVVGATMGPRVAIPHEVLTGAVRVHGLVGIGPVVVMGGFARVDGPSWALGDTAADTSTIGLGPIVGARLPLGRVEARIALEPSAALVVDRTGAKDAELDARIGVGADAVVALGSSLGLIVGLDAELSPFRLGDGRRGDGSSDAEADTRGRDGGEPPMPRAMLGLRIGIEVRP